MRIVDSHHHLWDLGKNYYPWLSDQVRTVSYGDYSAIRKNYLLEDFRRDIRAVNVVKSVHVQAESQDPVAETQWLQNIADDPESGGFPHAIVCYVDLSGPRAKKTLARHCTFTNVRGVRQMLHFGAAATYLRNETWRRNLAALTHFGLSFDLQILPSQAAEAAEIIASNPNIEFVLDHAGSPTQAALLDKSWQAAISLLAQFPNLSIKLSGFGMFDGSWTAATIEPIVQHVFQSFGSRRCMFGSNFPVDSLMKDYNSIWDAFSASVSALPRSEQELILAGNAERLYRI
ncbi:MAG: amidohydrolase family protein [Pseudolabrys sp.]|nr:amidohydrolase family protein [Pseudolabrys sp.]MDP2295429.1 amidohydrolase family protein [Pseudolabrys sp.]